jgi:HEAT repeat protein
MFLKKCAHCGKDIPGTMVLCPYCRTNDKGESADSVADAATLNDPRLLADIQALGHHDEVVRQEASQRIVQRGAAAGPLLVKTVAEHTQRGVAEAARLLGILRERRGIPVLREAIKIGDEELRIAAVWALTQFNEAQVPDELFAEAERNNPAVQAYVAHYLSAHPDQRVGPLLQRLSRNPNREVAYQSIWALGERGDKSAIPLLRRMLVQKDPVLHTAIESALRRLGGPVRRMLPAWSYAAMASGIGLIGWAIWTYR